jgi:hypothetical protein
MLRISDAWPNVRFEILLSSEYEDNYHLGHNAMRPGEKVRIFQKKMLHPSSGYKLEAASSLQNIAIFLLDYAVSHHRA